MQNGSVLVRKITSAPWLPAVLTIAGFLTYILRSVEIARTKTSFLDEGLYLYKGYLFVNGLQPPFADYGVWTNHAILSFLIPGYVQKWFGAGLETGRYFMIFLSLFTLLGLWVFAKRWGNAWWAAGVVWVMVLNPAEIKIHTLAISEGLVAALLVWIVLLAVGEKRPLWQILLSAALTAPLVLTRENMAFVPPILFLYIFWQHGWKAGLLAMLCAGSLVSGLTVWLLLPFRNVRPISERMGAVIFLSVLLIVLYIAHLQVAFFGEFCISCILLYVGYFDFLGLMLLVIAVPILLKELTRLRQIIIFVVIALLILGIGFSSHEDLSSGFAKAMIERLDGTYIWGAMIHYLAFVPQLILFRVTFVLLVSALVIVIGALALGLVYRRYKHGQLAGGRTGILALNLFLILGLILSPTRVLGLGNDFFDCGGTNVFASYQKAGAALSQVIEPGSKIYWEGRIPAIFLYMPNVNVYPPQLNHVHSYFVGGGSDILLRFSHWNDELARQWLEEADYIMVQNTEKVYSRSTSAWTRINSLFKLHVDLSETTFEPAKGPPAATRGAQQQLSV